MKKNKNNQRKKEVENTRSNQLIGRRMVAPSKSIYHTPVTNEMKISPEVKMLSDKIISCKVEKYPKRWTRIIAFQFKNDSMQHQRNNTCLTSLNGFFFSFSFPHLNLLKPMHESFNRCLQGQSTCLISIETKYYSQYIIQKTNIPTSISFKEQKSLQWRGTNT